MVREVGLKVNNGRTVLSLTALTSYINEKELGREIPYVIKMALMLSSLTDMHPAEALDVLYKNDPVRDVVYDALLTELKKYEEDKRLLKEIKRQSVEALNKALSVPKNMEDALSRVLLFLNSGEIKELEESGLVFDVKKQKNEM